MYESIILISEKIPSCNGVFQVKSKVENSKFWWNCPKKVKGGDVQVMVEASKKSQGWIIPSYGRSFQEKSKVDYSKLWSICPRNVKGGEFQVMVEASKKN